MRIIIGRGISEAPCRSTRWRRRRRRGLFPLSVAIFLFSLISMTTVVWAESRGILRDYSMIPPPPPGPPVSSATHTTTSQEAGTSIEDERSKNPPPPPPPKVPASRMETLDTTPKRPPPPPPPRRTPPTNNVDEVESLEESTVPGRRIIPPPPPPPPPRAPQNDVPGEEMRVDPIDAVVESPLSPDGEQEDSSPISRDDDSKEGDAIQMPDRIDESASAEEEKEKPEDSNDTMPASALVQDQMKASLESQVSASKEEHSIPSSNVNMDEGQPEEDRAEPSELSETRDDGNSRQVPLWSTSIDTSDGNQWSSSKYLGTGEERPNPPNGDSSSISFGPASNQPTTIEQNPAVQQGWAADPRQIQNYQSQQTTSSQFQAPIRMDAPPQAYGPAPVNQYGPIRRDAPPRAYGPAPVNQYGPPRPQSRPPPRSSDSIVSSSWKAIWGKVEKGLDSLAQVEDVVTGRAQQLVSRVSPSSSQGRPSYRKSEEERTWAKRERVAKMSTPTKTPLTPYGQKYEVAKRKQQEGSKQDPTISATVSSRQVNWNDLHTGKLIRANGGASSPDGQHPVPPINKQASMSGPFDQTPMAATGSTEMNQSPDFSNPQSNAGTGQYIANPYLQSGNLKTPPKQSSLAADPHARSARIPWDSSSSSSSAGYAASARQSPGRSAPSALPDYEEKTQFMSKLLRFIPAVPKMLNPAKILRLGKKSNYEYATLDAWRDDDEESSKGRGLFGFFRGKPKDGVVPPASARPTVKSGEAMAPPLKSMMARCDQGKTNSLLSASDEVRCRTIGRYQAFCDGLSVLFVLIAVQQVDGLGGISLPASLAELTSTTLPMLGSLVQGAVNTWAPIFAGYAYLAFYANRALLNSSVHSLATAVGSTVEDESQYAQLYLRLAAAVRMDPSLPATLRQAAASQVKSLVSTARLNAFVTMMLGCLIAMTVSFIGPCIATISQSMTQLVLLEEWRSWPVPWKAVGTNMQHIFRSLGLNLENHMARGLTGFLENPLQFAFHLSIFASSVLITMIPGIERRKKVQADKDDDEDAVLSSGDSAQQFAKLGSSSATRLTMLSENGSIENALERWRSTRGLQINESSRGAMIMAIRRLAYTILAAVIATLPIAVSYLVGMTAKGGMTHHFGLKWDSILDVSVVLVGVFMVASHAIQNVVAYGQKRRVVKSFLMLLSTTLDEIRETNRRQGDIQFMASVSPTAGLVVKDLWAAHTTKRAWAVRGANLQCKNGEILAILGDDGTGKTRMLTAIAEALIAPPRRSLTSNKVRGFVGIGGIDGSKWDKAVLKRRLGVLLSDVRTVADTANLYSGWSMEEILEPVDGLRSYDAGHKLNSSEKASILLALKMTGLYTTLIPKLPSKLSTVLTANEEDLRPSALRPRCQVLSPAEWSKLILAKVLAQTIYDNDNAAASTDKVENCMVGSVLLLDDPTVLLSEVEEAKILKELRQSGAATVLATNKWATGRFADHIVVVRDGAIVESGTHNELISRGPQQSLYAAKWHAMTMQ